MTVLICSFLNVNVLLPPLPHWVGRMVWRYFLSHSQPSCLTSLSRLGGEPFSHTRAKANPSVTMLLSVHRQTSGTILFLVSSHALVTILIIITSSFPSLPSACTLLERDSLLSFLFHNNTKLASWHADNDNCCTWEGVSCDARGSVTALRLPLHGLTGSIPPSLSNLTSLSHLNLSHNRLSGTLPLALLSSPRLAVLDVSFNFLTGALHVPTPGNRSALQVLNVSSNYFTGVFPSFTGQNLVAVNASNNSFSGSIPSPDCARLSPFLRILDFSINQFSGDIPRGLGNCSRIMVFSAGHNYLTGMLPTDIFNASALTQLLLPSNQISGSLDGGLIVNLFNLVILDLSSNQLRGEIPASISKLANLEVLLLYSNQLSGTLPSTLSNCTKLRCLNLRANHLSGQLSDAMDFSKLSNLSTLDLGNNNFTGEIPESVYACRSLTALRLARNLLKGQISPAMINLQLLSYLSLSNNNLSNITGAFQILKHCTGLTAILLHQNFIGEAMPDADWEDGGLENLTVLSLGDCQLTGQVPIWLAKLKMLEALDLSGNQLTGSLPGWLGSLPRLFHLEMSDNRLSGEFPKGLTGLQVLASEQAFSIIEQDSLKLPIFVNPDNASGLQYNQLDELHPAIYLKNNSLGGIVPQEIGQLKMLHVLDLSYNNFSGYIPVQLSNLTNLESLDLSSNQFSGTIPAELTGLHFLAAFNVAHNDDLEGLIPSGGQFGTFLSSSYEGDPKLCGSIIMRPCTTGDAPPMHKRRNRKLLANLGICFGGASTFTILAFCILYIIRKKGSERPVEHLGSKIDLDELSFNTSSGTPVVVSYCSSEAKDLTFSDILKATDNFDRANIIGCGGSATVYKATLANGSKLAIKWLSSDICLMEREFKAEVEALSTAQHRNLVSLQGYCMHGSFRLLIYSYMENGSVDDWLHERADGASSMLDWPTRLKIAQGASQGLSYIHQICQPHIVHRDIKSSNILLNHKFEAHVADFGLSRLILPYDTHVTTELVGTLGYIPPEYGQAWVATLRGDIYSFGVVLLELLTGRRPVEIFMPMQSRELVGWVLEMTSQGKYEKIFDEVLRGHGFEEQMLQVLNISCMCVQENPLKRPTIQEVVSCLQNIGSVNDQPAEDINIVSIL